MSDLFIGAGLVVWRVLLFPLWLLSAFGRQWRTGVDVPLSTDDPDNFDHIAAFGGIMWVVFGGLGGLPVLTVYLIHCIAVSS